MATAQLPPSAPRYHRISALTAERAAREAQKARRRGVAAVHTVVVTHQVAQARLAEQATTQMLNEQGTPVEPDAQINPAAFTTTQESLGAMLGAIEADLAFTQLVSTLTQDAGRTAQSVSQVTRPGVAHIRQLTAPSCSRCAILAGRVYTWSTGFLRHPRCDCTMVPYRARDRAAVNDPVELMRQGKVTGLSKADQQAINDGADFGKVVNVRRKSAGLTESGQVLTRRGWPTPAGIYRTAAGDRNQALNLLHRYGYIL